MNAIAVNGIAVNGIAVNAIAMNAIAVDGGIVRLNSMVFRMGSRRY